KKKEHTKMKKSFAIKTMISGLLIFVLLFGYSLYVYSYGNGVAGRTLLGSTPGCTCHSNGQSTAVVVTLTGPTTLTVGQTGTYTVTITRSTGSTSTGGIDVAVSSGTLGIGTSTGTKILSGELVHSTPFSSGVTTTKTFSFTAPNTVGPVTMAAIGAKGPNPPNWNHAINITINVTPVSGITKTEETANSYKLEQNYPNPFNPVTKINYSIPKSSNVTINIFDILGQKVSSLVDERQDAGTYSVDFNASELSSGVYYYKIEAGEFSSFKKMTLVK
ncbi:MAG: T9SS type A sorting domain-containing protein, partial [Ignavibacteriae bacterium]|nr:T9SS type A sorting domain-containing protein [Ignavibacteriota bacterium]